MMVDGDPPLRRRFAALAGGGLLAVAVFGALMLRGSAPPRAVVASLATEKWTPEVAAAQAEAAALAAEGYTTVKVTLDDLLEFESVCRWVERSLGYADCKAADEAVLYQYVPTRLEFKVKETLVEKGIGAQAATGHVAFNLAAYSGGPNTILSSWMIVADYRGKIKAIEPVEYGGELYRVFGLKLWDDAKLVLAAGKSGKLRGPAFTFDWSTGTLDELVSKTFDIHDVQRAHSGTDIWTLGSDLTYQELSVADDGKELKSEDLSKTTTMADPNHFQLVDDDAYAYVSARLNNAIYKILVASGKNEWILGGDDGDFAITGYDGKTYAAGESYWYGQHNAEYFGEGEFLMFDNNYEEERVDDSRNSRLLAVKIDEDARTANVTFEYDVGTYSDIFGDHDRLPSANVLACYWPSETMAYADQYAAKIVEVDRDTSDLAFELKVVTKDMSEESCRDDVCRVMGGFFMYSVERFYDAPLVYDVVFDEKKGTLDLTTHNTYKQSTVYQGTAYAYDADGALQAKATFDFAAFWRPSYVSLSGVSSSGTVVVENQHGTSRTVAFS